MKKQRSLGIVLVMLCVMCVAQAQAQVNLKEIAQEYGTSWVAGYWTATTDDGTDISVSYAWRLNGYAVAMDVKMGEYAYHGLVYYSVMDDQVVEMGIDNQGRVKKATWDVVGDKLVSTATSTGTDGESRKMAITHEKIDNKTMKLEVFSVDEYGYQADDPWASLNFKKTKRPTPRKDKAAAQGKSVLDQAKPKKNKAKKDKEDN